MARIVDERFADSVHRLRSAQKSAKGAPLYSVLVNRPLGRVFAAAAYQAGLTPNQVTAISAVFTFAGIGVLAAAEPSWAVGVIVAVLLVLGYALDSSDGQLARLRGGGSLLGEWLDHVIDSVKIVSVHLAVAVMAYRFLPGSDLWLLIPLLMTVVSVVHFFGFLLTDLLRRGNGAPKRTGDFSLMMSVAKLPTDYGVLCLVFVLIGAPLVFMGVYTLITICTALYTVLVLTRWAGQVRALDAATAPTHAGDERVTHV